MWIEREASWVLAHCLKMVGRSLGVAVVLGAACDPGNAKPKHPTAPVEVEADGVTSTKTVELSSRPTSGGRIDTKKTVTVTAKKGPHGEVETQTTTTTEVVETKHGTMALTWQPGLPNEPAED